MQICLIKRVIHFVVVPNPNSARRAVLDGGHVWKMRTDGSHHTTEGSVRFKKNALVMGYKNACV